MQIRYFHSDHIFIEKSYQFVVETLAEAIQLKKMAYIGLSGGKTPIPLYKQMSQMTKDLLYKTECFLIDERYTSLESEDSNYKMVLQTIFKDKPASLIPHLHGFSPNLPIEECLRNYEGEVKKIPSLEFDLIILGIGIDGHYASIFPDTQIHQKNPPFTRQDPLVLHTQTEVFTVKDRLSLAPSIIFKAKKILALLKGDDKKGIIHELEKGQKSPDEFPAKIFLNHPNFTLFYQSS